MLPKEAVNEFMELYHKNFCVRLSDEEAEEKANKFYNFMKLIMRPIEESTKLAEQIPGQDSKAERDQTIHGNQTKSKKG